MGKKSILLVEDDAPLRMSLREILSDDFNVLETSCYSEAIRYLDKSLDLALIDFSLPDRDGCEVLRTLRKARPSLHGIIMTGYGCESVAIKALRAGAIDYLNKPINMGYLLERISEILDATSSNCFQKSKIRPGETKIIERREQFIMDGMAAYIEEHYADERLSLDVLANLSAMNKFKFCRIFKERHGCGYVMYLNRIRIKNSCELLKKSGLSITEVAQLSGYKNIQHFDRIFSAFHGVSPSEYRKKLFL